MSLNRILKYFATQKGRVFTMNCVAVTGIGMFCVNYVPQSFLIDHFKGFLQAYKHGLERKVPETLYRRFEYAMDICRCTEFEKKHLQPFITFGFDTLQIGSTKSRFGGLIGIPTNYLYDKISDIERADMRTKGGKEISWSSNDGQNLQNSLILSEAEQVFGMARSILLIKSHKLLLESFYAPFSLYTVYGIASYINQKQNLFARPLPVRMVLYTLVGFFGIGLYSLITDATQVKYEMSVDEELAKLGPEMAAIGITFYDKLLKKNVALRNLTKENIYTASGNENFLLRQKNLPLTVRKCFFETKVNEFAQPSPAAAVVSS